VLADIAAIHTMNASDPPRAATWQETFARLYELDFETHQADILKAPIYLSRICDIMATMKLDLKPTAAHISSPGLTLHRIALPSFHMNTCSLHLRHA
jgi:hypothetical protein